MPFLNPFIWLSCGLTVAASFSAAAIVGFVAFGIVTLSVRPKNHAQSTALAVSLPVGAIAFVVTFCALMAWADFDPSKPMIKPDEADLIGTWTLTRLSLDKMRRDGGYEITTHSLTLDEDGTFELVNMPDWWGNGRSSQGFLSGSGSWRLAQSLDRFWGVSLEFDQLNGAAIRSATHLNIAREGPGYVLYVYIGNPDSGNAMVFEKAAASDP